MPTLQLASNLLQAVRAHYGLALAPLAACLGVSGSLLGLAATNRRELPTAAYLRLRPLAEALPPPLVLTQNSKSAGRQVGAF